MFPHTELERYLVTAVSRGQSLRSLGELLSREVETTREFQPMTFRALGLVLLTAIDKLHPDPLCDLIVCLSPAPVFDVRYALELTRLAWSHRGPGTDRVLSYLVSVWSLRFPDLPLLLHLDPVTTEIRLLLQQLPLDVRP